MRGSSSLALARFRAGFVWPYAGAALRRYCNRIPKIEGLDSLVNLETLWLNDNLITELAGLTALVNLRCCFLASNKIDRVGNGFDSCTQLEDVNLSNNLIGCFREIPNLGRLPNLQSCT